MELSRRPALPTGDSGPRHGRLYQLPTRAFTLVELAVTVTVAGAIALSAVTGLLAANRVGVVERTRTSARMLCQDRIEQALSQPFVLPNTVPAIFGTWPVPATQTTTATDTVQVYSDTGGAALINATRTLLVSRPDTTRNYVLVTARVDYTYRGSNYRQEISTVRAPD